MKRTSLFSGTNTREKEESKRESDFCKHYEQLSGGEGHKCFVLKVARERESERNIDLG